MLQRPRVARPVGSSKRHGVCGATGWARKPAVACRRQPTEKKPTAYRTCMTETKETTDKTLRGAVPRKPLSLKRTVESGHVRQNFSHGRSKSVVVEKKKKRTISGPGGTEGDDATTPQSEADRLLAEVMQRPGALSSDELGARRRALEAERERAEREEKERARLEALRPPAPPPAEEPAP